MRLDSLKSCCLRVKIYGKHGERWKTVLPISSSRTQREKTCLGYWSRAPQGTTFRVGHCQVSPKGECGNWLKNGLPLAPSGQFSGGVVIPPNYSIHHPRMNGYFGNHFGAILNLKVWDINLTQDKLSPVNIAGGGYENYIYIHICISKLWLFWGVTRPIDSHGLKNPGFGWIEHFGSVSAFIVDFERHVQQHANGHVESSSIWT